MIGTKKLLFCCVLFIVVGCQSTRMPSGEKFYRLAPWADEIAETVITINEESGEKLSQGIGLISPEAGGIALVLSGIIGKLGLAYRKRRKEYLALETRNEKIIQGSRAASDVIDTFLKGSPEWEKARKILKIAANEGAINPDKVTYRNEIRS